MSGSDWNTQLTRIRSELSDLAQFVDDARKGVDGLKSTVKLSSEKFPEASGQLKTVTGDLENATNTLMTMLEELIDDHDRSGDLLKKVAGWVDASVAEDRPARESAELVDTNSRMKARMMEMFANLAFHDLSGQKLKKVIATLEVVEAKVIELACSFGFGGKADVSGGLEVTKAAAEARGPFDQDEVDKLLKELKQSSVA